ncbi:homeotic protein spalt-major-like [Artemia franciscana]
MSRRKQSKPIRHSDEFGVEQCIVENRFEGKVSGSYSAEEGAGNPAADLIFQGVLSDKGNLAGTSVSGSVSQDESESEQEHEDHQDSTNNNQRRKRERHTSTESLDEDNQIPESMSEALRMANPFLNGNALEAAYSPFLPPATNLININNALDALQNTRMAIAQFAASAFTNNPQNPNSIQELASLQSTLYGLHQQQFLQMQLIHQLQQQVQITQKGPIPPQKMEKVEDIDKNEKLEEDKESQKLPEALNVQTGENDIHYDNLPSLADSILQTSEPLPAPDAPSTLEMLQRSTQQVLNNASQGLLSSNLADELGFRAASANSSDGKNSKDGMFKHRCRYCGKVFSSDSALQIHIRSHTGERPFKCNICGNRFTTKGNLKVHFQRHAARFPHIKMNPHPVPEHLDRFHPPLLSQLEIEESPQNEAKSPGSNSSLTNVPLAVSGQSFPRPPMGVISNFPSPLYRSFNPDLIRARQPFMFNSESLLDKEEVVHRQKKDQEMPQNLIKEYKSDTPVQGEPNEATKLLDKIGEKQENEDKKSQEENLLENQNQLYDECSLGSKYSSDEEMNQEIDEEEEQSCDETPENLSLKPLQLQPHQILPPFPHPHMRFPLSIPGNPLIPFREGPPVLHHGQGSILLPSDVDPAKDPAIYTNLLPRPGSNDNAWETLIEVTKASETTKLQQLVDSIENKMSDPNQCVICHRVLSCKSALQMHYRTHTGERPFKCKICGRAFTTKGNLKTHMGVHRAKPPSRLLHICPVCHRKFTNGIVLQQHIRLHTGEPTDLTHEQIQAAEVRDFPVFPFMGAYPNPFFTMPHFGLRIPNEENDKSFNNIKSEVRSGSPFDSIPSEPPASSPAGSERRNDTDEKKAASESESDQSDEYRTKSSQGSFAPLDLTSVSNVATGLDQKSPVSSPLASLTSTSLPTTFNPLNLPVAPGRGNTTCNICFKTFACHSALEIHYRSHTKERPFRCNICDRGFSTKGNMKQHMMTHKGMEGDMSRNSKSLSISDVSQEERSSSELSLPDFRINCTDSDKEKTQSISFFAQFCPKDPVLPTPVGYWGNFLKQEGEKRYMDRISPQGQGVTKDGHSEDDPTSPTGKPNLSPDYPKVFLTASTSGSELDLSTKSSHTFVQHASRPMLPLP